MRSRIIGVIALGGLVLTAAGGRVYAQSGHELFQQALSKERIEGNLEEAIRLYARIVDLTPRDRVLAARALLEMGRCYEKLAHADAAKVYERIVQEYADQAEAAGQAKMRLLSLAPVPSEARRPSPTPAATVRPLPRIDAINDLQALSPDGSKATYINYEQGQNLAIYDFATGRSTLLTNFTWTGSGVGSEPAGQLRYALFGVWSPDGRRVAFMEKGVRPDSVAELRVATLDGQSQIIFRNEAHPGGGVRPASWLPDGRALVVVVERSDKTTAIGLIPAAGGQFRPLRSLPWTAESDAPQLSPDGRYIAFVEGAPGRRDVKIVSVDGRTGSQVTDHPGDDRQPIWSPDGRHLVFISQRNGVAALWAVGMRGGQPEGEAIPIRGQMQDVSLVGWTDTGLLYTQRSRTQDIYRIPIDPSSSEPTGIAHQLPYERTGRNHGPVWSPDGKHLAFISSSPAEPNRRYVVLLAQGDGEPREFLIPTTRYDFPQSPYDLRWFGDGTGLGFSGFDGKGDPTVFRLTLATGSWKTIALPVKAWTRIEWNADGSRIFYARQGVSGESSEIIEWDVETAVERLVFRLDAKPSVIRGLRLAPDRRSLAFTSTAIEGEQTTLALTIVDVATGAARRVVEEIAGPTFDEAINLGTPAWTPDGETLSTTRINRMATRLLLIPLHGGSRRAVSLDRSLVRLSRPHPGEPERTIAEVVWSPDGRSLTAVVSSWGSDSWVLEQPLDGPATLPRR